ncbi:unnamed protein product [Moneuplotes crassus]|uniref:Uncharacterized protein n=1 Tax=Euplotes crassus TaxID=5936 RepID=A0AAD1XNK7_EUPCR|nr:unnamed protein product [Moneuplotes crassus]
MNSAYWDCQEEILLKSEGDEFVGLLLQKNSSSPSKSEITQQNPEYQLIPPHVAKEGKEDSEFDDEGLLELSSNEDMQAKADYPGCDTLNKEEFSSGPSKSTNDTEEDQKHNSTNSENTEGMNGSTSLPFEESKENNESPHRYRTDNMSKAGFRGLIQMVGRKFKEDISKFQGENLMKYPSKNLSVLYELLKSTYEQALGHAVSEKDFFKVYGILLKLSISTKERREVLNSYGNTLRESALSNSEEFIYHRSHYTKKSKKYFSKHPLLLVAKNLFSSQEWLREVFKDFILNENQKKVINDPQRYYAEILELLNL